MAIAALLILAKIMTSVAHCKTSGSSNPGPTVDSGQVSCLRNSDCSLGEACRDGICTKSCIFDSDCFPSQYCCEDKCSDVVCGSMKINLALLIALVVFGFATFMIMILIAIMILIKVLCTTEQTGRWCHWTAMQTGYLRHTAWYIWYTFIYTFIHQNSRVLEAFCMQQVKGSWREVLILFPSQ